MATATDNGTLQERASALYEALETATRANGDEYVRLREGSPQWMQDAIRVAHGDMFPDDWRYTLIERAAGIIAEDETDGEYHQAIDNAVDVYTASLTNWLASSIWRLGYCDEAQDEFGPAENLSSLLQMGQYRELDEIVGLLYNALA